MDPNVGDTFSNNHDPKDLPFYHDTFFHIPCTNLVLTACPRQIEDILRNTLYAISLSEIFDIEDLFLRSLVGAAEYPRSPKVYAPWIQMLISYGSRQEVYCRHGPKYFTPPVRNTLHVTKDNDKGKSISPPEMKKAHETIHIKKKDVLIPKHKNPLLFEVCVRTQQMIDKHLHEDRKEKEPLDAEVNHIANAAR